MTPLTDAEVAALESGDQENQVYRIGQRIKDNEDDRVIVQTYGLVAIKLEVTADASAGINFTMPNFAFEIVDVTVHCTDTQGGGTLTLRRDTTAISDAIACATDGAVDRAASIVQAQKDVTAGEVLNIIANGADDRGEMFIIGRRS